jgi:hypothetical protein
MKFIINIAFLYLALLIVSPTNHKLNQIDQHDEMMLWGRYD